jgi:hypothetical protein
MGSEDDHSKIEWLEKEKNAGTDRRQFPYLNIPPSIRPISSESSGATSGTTTGTSSVTKGATSGTTAGTSSATKGTTSGTTTGTSSATTGTESGNSHFFTHLYHLLTYEDGILYEIMRREVRDKRRSFIKKAEMKSSLPSVIALGKADALLVREYAAEGSAAVNLRFATVRNP